MRISDWSSDVCSSDLPATRPFRMLPCRQVSVVAVGALHALVPLLGFDGEGGDRPRLEAAQRDRLAGFLAVAVRIFLDAPERGVDLGDQLALPVTGPQF